MDYLKFNDVAIPYGNSFTLSQSPNITNETVTLNGNTIYDWNGWKYDDLTISWDYLKQDELLQMIEETNPMNGWFNFTFIDLDQSEKTVRALRKSGVTTKTQHRDSEGNIIWTGISITITFFDIYR